MSLGLAPTQLSPAAIFTALFFRLATRLVAKIRSISDRKRLGPGDPRNRQFFRWSPIRCSKVLGCLALIACAYGSTGSAYAQQVLPTPTREYVYLGERLIAIDNLAPVPAAPTSLTATKISASRIDLAWTDNSTTENGFKIDRKTGSGGTWTEITTVGVNVHTYSDNTLSASTTYFYRVRAYNASGASAYTNEASATTDGPPVAPSNVVATAISSSQVTLTWTDNSSTETGFKIERQTGAGAWTQTKLTAVNVTSYADRGLSSQTTYSYRIRATNTFGDSAYSNTSTATTLPPQPTSISYSPTSVAQGDNFTATVGNGAWMVIDQRYRYNGGVEQIVPSWATQNGSGQSVHSSAASAPGTYTTTGIRNHLNTAWVPMNVSIVVTPPLPPQPASLSIVPGSVSQGQCYTMTVGNGANMTLDVQYTYNGGAVQEIIAGRV